MKTPRCLSVMGRRFRSPTSSREQRNWLSKILPDARAARVLEVGTGCGYAAAVLAQLFGEVVSVERLRALHEKARENLRSLRLSNVRLILGDGALGVSAAAPFDAIVAAAAGDKIPPAWIEQLKVGGRIVAPVGSWNQQLTIAIKDANGSVQNKPQGAGTLRPITRRGCLKFRWIAA